MITLYGFAVSNYYNIVKMALLEKEIPFQEQLLMTGSTAPEVLEASPLGKIPYIKTDSGSICESQAILEYIEATAPTPALLPNNAFASAKVRELIIYINLYLELEARKLYKQAFFGGTVSDSVKEKVKTSLTRHIEGFKHLIKFTPYIAGDTFSMADIVAFNNLPLVGMATRAIYGEDMLMALGIDYKAYIKLLSERSSAQRIIADRKTASTKTT